MELQKISSTGQLGLKQKTPTIILQPQAQPQTSSHNDMQNPNSDTAPKTQRSLHHISMSHIKSGSNSKVMEPGQFVISYNFENGDTNGGSNYRTHNMLIGLDKIVECEGDTNNRSGNKLHRVRNGNSREPRSYDFGHSKEKHLKNFVGPYQNSAIEGSNTKLGRNKEQSFGNILKESTNKIRANRYQRQDNPLKRSYQSGNYKNAINSQSAESLNDDFNNSKQRANFLNFGHDVNHKQKNLGSENCSNTQNTTTNQNLRHSEDINKQGSPHKIFSEKDKYLKTGTNDITENDPDRTIKKSNRYISEHQKRHNQSQQHYGYHHKNSRENIRQREPRQRKNPLESHYSVSSASKQQLKGNNNSLFSVSNYDRNSSSLLKPSSGNYPSHLLNSRPSNSFTSDGLSRATVNSQQKLKHNYSRQQIQGYSRNKVGQRQQQKRQQQSQKQEGSKIRKLHPLIKAKITSNDWSDEFHRIESETEEGNETCSNQVMGKEAKDMMIGLGNRDERNEKSHNQRGFTQDEECCETSFVKGITHVNRQGELGENSHLQLKDLKSNGDVDRQKQQLSKKYQKNSSIDNETLQKKKLKFGVNRWDDANDHGEDVDQKKRSLSRRAKQTYLDKLRLLSEENEKKHKLQLQEEEKRTMLHNNLKSSRFQSIEEQNEHVKRITNPIERSLLEERRNKILQQKQKTKRSLSNGNSSGRLGHGAKDSIEGRDSSRKADRIGGMVGQSSSGRVGQSMYERSSNQRVSNPHRGNKNNEFSGNNRFGQNNARKERLQSSNSKVKFNSFEKRLQKDNDVKSGQKRFDSRNAVGGNAKSKINTNNEKGQSQSRQTSKVEAKNGAKSRQSKSHVKSMKIPEKAIMNSSSQQFRNHASKTISKNNQNKNEQTQAKTENVRQNAQSNSLKNQSKIKPVDKRTALEKERKFKDWKKGEKQQKEKKQENAHLAKDKNYKHKNWRNASKQEKQVKKDKIGKTKAENQEQPNIVVKNENSGEEESLHDSLSDRNQEEVENSESNTEVSKDQSSRSLSMQREEQNNLKEGSNAGLVGDNSLGIQSKQGSFGQAQSKNEKQVSNPVEGQGQNFQHKSSADSKEDKADSFESQKVQSADNVDHKSQEKADSKPIVRQQRKVSAHQEKLDRKNTKESQINRQKVMTELANNQQLKQEGILQITESKMHIYNPSSVEIPEQQIDNQQKNQGIEMQDQQLSQDTYTRAPIVKQLYNLPQEFKRQLEKFEDPDLTRKCSLLKTKSQDFNSFIKSQKLRRCVEIISSSSILIDSENIKNRSKAKKQEKNKSSNLPLKKMDFFQMISEPFLRASDGKVGIWLYCVGVWRLFCFGVEKGANYWTHLEKCMESACQAHYGSNKLQDLTYEQILRMITGLRILKISKSKATEKSKVKMFKQIEYSLRKGYIVQGLLQSRGEKQRISLQTINYIKKIEETPTGEKVIQVISYEVAENPSKVFKPKYYWIKQEKFLTMFESFTVVCKRLAGSYWSNDIAQIQDSSKAVYQIDSESKAISGSISIYAKSGNRVQNSQEAKTSKNLCTIAFYKEVEPQVLKLVGKVIEKVPTVDSSLHLSKLYFDFNIKGNYYVFLDLQNGSYDISIEANSRVDWKFVESIRKETNKNEHCEYVEIDKVFRAGRNGNGEEKGKGNGRLEEDYEELRKIMNFMKKKTKNAHW